MHLPSVLQKEPLHRPPTNTGTWAGSSSFCAHGHWENLLGSSPGVNCPMHMEALLVSRSLRIMRATLNNCLMNHGAFMMTTLQNNQVSKREKTRTHKTRRQSYRSNNCGYMKSATSDDLLMPF